MSFDPDDSLIDPLDALLSAEPSAAPVPGPDGFFPNIVMDPEPLPEATPEHFICLRGPCRHYMETSVMFPASNPRGQLKKPKQITRMCSALPQTYMDLTDENVYTCSKWSPLTPAELTAEEQLREDYYQRNPQISRNGE